MKIERSILDTSINIVCLIQLVGIVVYLALAWNSLPEQIPGHFGIDGVVTRYDSRGALLLMPIFAWVLYGGVSLLERFPQVWNTGVIVTDENSEQVYKIIKNLLGVTKLIVVTAFAYITIMQSLAQSLAVWFMPAFLYLLFGSIIYFTYKLIRAR